MRRILLLGIWLAGCMSNSTTEPIRPADRILPYSENPGYWQYKGRPVFLIGGSVEDNLFQIDSLEAHLDLLARSGGNYIRNTMSSRDEGNVWPYVLQEDGKYDLERLSDDYYRRFERLLELTRARDIVVQIELWDRFDFAREPWMSNPYRPANNINYSDSVSGLANEYPRHPGQNDNPFFRSIPAHDNNAVLLRFQHAQVDRLLSIALPYPNVLYTMDNETSATPRWGAYWSEYIKTRAAAQGLSVQTTEMWDAWNLRNEEHRATLDHPEQYAFADISQNNHNRDQVHWDNLQWVRRYTAAAPRPLNHVKIYGSDTGRYGTDRDGIERFWRILLGGGASARFHRPPSGLGLNEDVQACLKGARTVLAEFDVFRAEPDSASRLLREREPDEAYVSTVGHQAYLVYFPQGGEAELDLRGSDGSYSVKRLNVLAGAWTAAADVTGGDWVPLSVADTSHTIFLLTRKP